jgi:UrcA family protein
VQTPPGIGASISAWIGKTAPNGPEGVIMKSTTVKRHALLGIALLAAALTANLASAAPGNDEPRRAVVRYSDLDLSQPKDAQRLYRRIKGAAHAVCNNDPELDLGLLKAYKACMTKAVTDAVDQVQSAQVAAIRRSDMHLSRN